ncbi:MAG: dipeptide ABC transporter ATP-binding protein [Cytophagales bacterium]|nr:dipeptide ABC transporter ATP-binding protein [Cytophagales bacterium]
MTAHETFAHKAFILQGKPICKLTGHEAPFGYAALEKWATAQFDALGQHAHHSTLGAIALDKRSVRDSMGHGMNPFKACAFAAVSAVIENGVVALSSRFKNEDHFFICAPVQIAEVESIVTVEVRKDANKQRMYLHSVSTKKNLLKARDSRADEEVSTSERSGKVTAGDVASVLNRLLTFKTDSPPILAIQHLHVSLPAGSDRAYAVQDVSFHIKKGQTLCVVGESGSGKSVMAMTMMGLLAKELQATSGKVLLNDESLLDAPPARLRALRGASMGMVFQEPMTALNPVMRCGEQVDELLREHTKLTRPERHAKILAIFERVQLPEPARMFASYPHQLSGGQRQRVVIAMAMILKPTLLICDEPTTALDVTTQQEILKLIAEIQTELGCAVLFITHDMGVVRQIADDVIVMHQGVAVEYGTATQLLSAPQAAYTKALLAAVPSMTPPAAKLISADAPVVLRADKVCKTYVTRQMFGKARSTSALIDASLALQAGETIGIVGESGSGKSTLARCLLRLIDPSEGHIHWGLQSIESLPESQLRALRSHIQVVFQDPNRSLNPRMRVGESLMEGAINFGKPVGLTKAQAWARAEALMDKVRLPRESLDRYPNQFSGGQRQRLAIARALACQPKVLVADEAVSALDVSVQAQIVALLKNIQTELGLGLLFITHDLRVAAQLCDRVIVMHQGRIVEQGTTGELYAHPTHEYTKRLFASAP